MFMLRATSPYQRGILYRSVEHGAMISYKAIDHAWLQFIIYFVISMHNLRHLNTFTLPITANVIPINAIQLSFFLINIIYTYCFLC